MIYSLFIYRITGEELYQHDFIDTSRIDLSGISSAFLSIFEEILRGKRPRRIATDDITLIFEYGKHIVGMAILDKETELIRSALQMAVERFEQYFTRELAREAVSKATFSSFNWVVDTIFYDILFWETAENLVNRIENTCRDKVGMLIWNFDEYENLFRHNLSGTQAGDLLSRFPQMGEKEIREFTHKKKGILYFRFRNIGIVLHGKAIKKRSRELNEFFAEQDAAFAELAVYTSKVHKEYRTDRRVIPKKKEKRRIFTFKKLSVFTLFLMIVVAGAFLSRPYWLPPVSPPVTHDWSWTLTNDVKVTLDISPVRNRTLTTEPITGPGPVIEPVEIQKIAAGWATFAPISDDDPLTYPNEWGNATRLQFNATDFTELSEVNLLFLNDQTRFFILLEFNKPSVQETPEIKEIDFLGTDHGINKTFTFSLQMTSSDKDQIWKEYGQITKTEHFVMSLYEFFTNSEIRSQRSPGLR
ncbi:MAG: hypothetical protein ACFFCQ_14410, partial [Promethearchaeota archaeon]